ncbi:MAG: HsdM family class I SAM-dependent methyltransferase [Streptosporangiaceae bacterium]
MLDPACCHGTLLLAVADRFGDRVRLAGQEIHEPAAAIAALNLRRSAHNVPYEIHAGDSLLDNQLSAYLGAAAAVVCEPPFDLPHWPSAQLTTDPRWEFGIPAPRDSELAWVQHCYAHLRPRGVAIVAVSLRTCVQPSGERIRAALVRSGALRHVITLPPHMSSVPGTDVCLWIMQRPYDAEHPAVGMIDLSRLPDAADVPHEFAAWQRLLNAAHPGMSRAVPRLELLDGGVSLLPSRHVAPRVEATAADLAAVTRRLQALYAHIGRGLPAFEPPKAPVRLLRHCRIPRLPLSEQRQYGDAFRRLHELRDVLTALAAVSTNVIDQVISGLITGVLTPGTPPLTDPDQISAIDDEMREP